MPAARRRVRLAPRLSLLQVSSRSAASTGPSRPTRRGRGGARPRRQVEPGRRGDPVEVESARRRRRRPVCSADPRIPAQVFVVAGGQPQLGRRPVGVVGEPVVAVGTAAVPAFVVRREQVRVRGVRHGTPSAPPPAAGPRRRSSSSRSSRAPWAVTAARCRVAAVDGRCSTRSVGSVWAKPGSGDQVVPCTRWNAIPANGCPAGTCIRISQSSCQRHSSTRSASARPDSGGGASAGPGRAVATARCCRSPRTCRSHPRRTSRRRRRTTPVGRQPG